MKSKNKVHVLVNVALLIAMEVVLSRFLSINLPIVRIVFGLFLHNRKGTIPQLACAVAINCIGISLLFSTLWLSMLYGTPYLQLLPTRLIQNLIMIPVQFTVLRLLQKPIGLYAQRQLA